ncbi:hypothetical protein [Rheinheimera sp.]|uniref:hypothetical protein n=2 Tax=Rheinheimera sp. TaxID=1869214 RepID=UPI0040487ABD
MAAIRIDVLETNIPELKNVSGTVVLRDDVITFPASSPLKISQIKLAAVSALTTLDSDKYYTTARLEFGEEKFLSFKAPTDPYLKNVKHKRFNKTAPLSVTEHVSALAGIGGFCLVMVVLSAFSGGGTNNSSSKNATPTVSAQNTRAAQKLIKSAGYRCDSVSYISQSSWDGSYRVTCNDDNYAYSIDDVGGNWIVTVK